MDSVPSEFSFHQVWNAWWCMILTMTTVGYGDIYPITVGGRIFTIVACIVGVFILSLIIAKLAELIQLNQEEQKAYDIIMGAEKKKRNEDIKVQLGVYFIRYRIGILLKKQPGEIFKRKMEYLRFKEKIHYNNE